MKWRKQMGKGMKRFLVSAYYSDWIIAGSGDEAISELSHRISAGNIKRHEWEISLQEDDEVYE